MVERPGTEAAASDRRVVAPRVMRGPIGTRFTSVEWFTEIDSTNRYLVDAARDGAGDGLVAVADVQHAGRGRLGRTWSAPPGASLLVSVLLRPVLAREAWPLLTAAAGMAAVETVTECCDLPAALKWPNDVLLGSRAKLAGVLAEATGDAVVIGMGLNVLWEAVPPELDGIAIAVSLAGGRVLPRAVLLTEWLRRLELWLGRLERGPDGAALLQQAQRARSATLGKRVRVELAAGELVGVAVDLDRFGALIIERDDGTRLEVAAGDVIHLR